jgi:phosphoribosylformylglycinamidine synthase subunit PurL
VSAQPAGPGAAADATESRGPLGHRGVPGGSPPQANTADTVTGAAATPQRSQPYAELGLTQEEYQRIRGLLGRRPTDPELALYSVMWSEHCSYKSSRVYLRQFADKAPQPVERDGGALLAGIGHNAGVVDIGQGYAATFKIESHNHPSYVEPFQGAATGVGGIVRDILAMGARPVAVMDSLRFGPADAPDTARVLPGVVGGISFYGNCLGLPNIGGELAFDPCYAGNPLVNALCVGVMRHEDLRFAAARGVGNKVILFGARTGPDGIGGASVLASASFGAGAAAKRPSVQVGDPFMEKLLVECCLELGAAGLLAGIQDLGAAGVSCATAELAAGGGSGMSVNLDLVPLRDSSLGPAEILMSESQERMMAIVEPRHVERFAAICARWDVPATVIGEVNGTGRLEMTWRGEVVVDIAPETAASQGPVYDRPAVRPASQDALMADGPGRLPRPAPGELGGTLLALLRWPDLADKTWVTEQYDRHVLGDTVLAAPENAGVIRVDEQTGLGVALATDGNGRYSRLDPYAGAQLALAEAYRNVAATGARPAAVTNCLNFGSPEDPGVMWQFAETVRGLADGCAFLGTPVTGGNVSFYNQTGQVPINPTPVVGVLGILPDVRRRLSLRFHLAGARLVLLGRTGADFGGSAWAWAVHGHLGGRPPAVDLAAERDLAAVLTSAAGEGLLAAAHDLSEGGLAIALAESCLAGATGARVSLPGDPFTMLFSESPARVVAEVAPGAEAALGALCQRHGVLLTDLGTVGGDRLDVAGCFSVALDELAAARAGVLPALFG